MHIHLLLLKKLVYWSHISMNAVFLKSGTALWLSYKHAYRLLFSLVLLTFEDTDPIVKMDSFKVESVQLG